MPEGRSHTERVPGVVMLWSGAGPCLLTFRLPVGGLTIGRELLAQLGSTISDDRISRRHAHITAMDHHFLIADLASRNGTYAGGQAIVDREISVTAPCVLRTGRTVSILVPDITVYEGGEVSIERGVVRGPSSRHAAERTVAAAQSRKNLVIMAESGSGKRVLADLYVRSRGTSEITVGGGDLTQSAGLPRGPLTVILEDAQHLSPSAQAALLQWLAQRDDLNVVTLTWGELDRLAGFDPALATKLSEVEVRLSPLRERPEELTHLVPIGIESAAPGLEIHSTLVEACLLRPWPGNERELLAALQRAGRKLTETGRPMIRGEDLEAQVGHLAMGAQVVTPGLQPALTSEPRRKRTTTKPD